MDDWEFYQHSNGQWWWRNVKKDSVSESFTRFGSFVDAMANAVEHGFHPGTSNIAAVQAVGTKLR
jgi:hypothetical protein